MKKQTHGNLRIRMVSHIAASAALLLAANAQAQDWYWIGGGSSNWSLLSNWNSSADGSGDAPEDIVADFAGKNVMLLTTGANLPSNQNVAGLAVRDLMFNNSLTSLEISGEPLQLERVIVSEEPQEAQSITFRNNIIQSVSGEWTLFGKVTAYIHGSFSEPAGGGAQAFGANSGGNIHFLGPVTISGGIQPNSAGVHLYGMETAGTLPGEFDENYFLSGWGSVGFHSPRGGGATTCTRLMRMWA